MSDDEKIRILLTSAGMLMEDASAKLIIGHGDVDAAASVLLETIGDLEILAKTIAVIQRVRNR